MLLAYRLHEMINRSLAGSSNRLERFRRFTSSPGRPLPAFKDPRDPKTGAQFHGMTTSTDPMKRISSRRNLALGLIVSPEFVSCWPFGRLE